MRVGIYRRVSTGRQTKGFSLDEQYDSLTGLAEARGWDWIDFCDRGRSAEALDGRPALAELLSSLDDLDAVLVVDDSRLAREEVTSAMIRERLRNTNTQLITPSGAVDLNDPQDQFTSGVVAFAHQLEQKLRTKKMTAGLRRAAASGYWTGGPPPYGYRIVDDPDGTSHRVLEIWPERADVLRTAVSLILDGGLTVYKATQNLNALGMTTQSGTPWHYRNLTYQLKKDHLSGTYTYSSAEGGIEVPIPPLLDEATHKRLQRAISRKPTGKPRKRKFYPLTGHLDCPCGGLLSGHPRPNGRSYKCSRNKPEWGDQRCDQYPRYRNADDLESIVWGEVKRVLTEPGYLAHLLEGHLTDQSPSTAMSQNQVRSIKRRIEAKKQEQVTITREYAAAGIDAAVLMSALDGAALDVEALEAQLARARQWDEVRRMKAETVAALESFAERAMETLARPTLEIMKQVFDLLDLRILIGSEGLRLVGTVPIGEWGETAVAVGEHRTGAPRAHGPHRPRSGRGAAEGPPGRGRGV